MRKSLETNHVDLKDLSVREFLNAVKAGGDAKERERLMIVGESSAQTTGHDILSYEDGKGHLSIIHGKKGLIRQIFSIWFGIPDDSGLEHLKTSLLHG